MSYMRHAEWADRWYNDVAKATPSGMEVQTVPLGGLMTFPELDRLWRKRDAQLLQNYQKVLDACQDADVFFSYGSGIHPEFLPYLRTFNCYFFCDDPEDSPWQSAKVASSFDAACYANIASSFQYESWKCQRHSWLPIFTAPGDVPPPTEKAGIFATLRAADVVFGGGLDDYSSYRARRLRRMKEQFPDALCYGRGWPLGSKSYEELASIYRVAKLGWNIHRTTGPINRRMFQLPAHGVMQICDNKTGLGQIFELGKEVAGFDTVDEAIELTKYYLDHEAEREAVAQAGYERFWRDYHAEANWARLRDKLLEWGVKPGERKAGVKQKLPSRNVAYFVGAAGEKIRTEAQRVIRSAKAAKREYLQKDPWWQIFDRIFTSEAVYLPEYAEGTPATSKSPALFAELVVPTPHDSAVRWAMTQLIGNARRIAIYDVVPKLLNQFAGVDSKRQIQRLENFDFGKTVEKFDLILCAIPHNFQGDLLEVIHKASIVAHRGVFSISLSGKQEEKSRQIGMQNECFSPDAAYWLLRSAFSEVNLFHMPDPVVPWLEPIKNTIPKQTMLAMVGNS